MPTGCWEKLRGREGSLLLLADTSGDLIQLLATAVNKTQTFYGAFHLLKDANLFMGGCNSARVCIGQLGLGCVIHILSSFSNWAHEHQWGDAQSLPAPCGGMRWEIGTQRYLAFPGMVTRT